MITALTKTGILRTAYYQAIAAAISLFQRIVVEHEKAFSDNWQGMTVMATSGNGRSTTLFSPDRFKARTRDETADLWEEIIQQYQTALVTLGISQPAIDDTSQDLNIFNTMLASDWAQDITSYKDDFTVIRYPTYGPTQ